MKHHLSHEEEKKGGKHSHHHEEKPPVHKKSHLKDHHKMALKAKIAEHAHKHKSK